MQIELTRAQIQKKTWKKADFECKLNYREV